MNFFHSKKKLDFFSISFSFLKVFSVENKKFFCYENFLCYVQISLLKFKYQLNIEETNNLKTLSGEQFNSFCFSKSVSLLTFPLVKFLSTQILNNFKKLKHTFCRALKIRNLMYNFSLKVFKFALLKVENKVFQKKFAFQKKTHIFIFLFLLLSK